MKVKWAFGNITVNKASAHNRIPAELFQILKDSAIKVLHWICQQIWKTQQWSRDWKRSALFPISKKGSAKECSNYCTVALISHTGRVMLCYLGSSNALQSRLQEYVNQEHPDVQAGFRRGRRTKDQVANIHWIIEKARKLKKKKIKSTSVSLTMLKPLTVWLTTTWKILKGMGIPDHLTCLLRNLFVCQEATVRTRHGTTDWLNIEKSVH